MLGKANGYLQPGQVFEIKKGYHPALTAEAFDDTGNRNEWQQEVYTLAGDVARAGGYTSVIDVGCGSGYKLLQMPTITDTVGIETGAAWSWLCRQYPDRKWLLFETTDPACLATDLVICADVIEHVENPDTLLKFISEMAFRRLVISTPERDLVAGKNDFGPPENTAHFREWNGTEFVRYISRYFTVESHRVFTGKSVTQVVICKK